MEEISKEIYQIIQKQFANPFSSKFNRSKVEEIINNNPTEQEVNIFRFIVCCNDLALGLKSNIFQAFQKLNIYPYQLRNLIYSFTNNNFIFITSRLTTKLEEGESYIEIGSSSFLTNINEQGQKEDLQAKATMLGDVFCKLLEISYEWEKTISEPNFHQGNEIDISELEQILKIAWLNANIMLNLEEAAFDVIAFENGKVYLSQNDSQIKIESGIKGVRLLEHVGHLRKVNNIHECFIPLIDKYTRLGLKKKGVKSVSFLKGELEIECGEVDQFTSTILAESEIIVFHEHFIDERLKKFNGYKILDLIEILVLIQELAIHITPENLYNFRELRINEVPVKVKKSNLINLLIDCTQKSKELILKVINTLTISSNDFNFWRAPLVEQGNFYLLFLPGLHSINYSLFIDKWTNIAGYSLDQKTMIFKSFILKELFGKKRTAFQFDQRTAIELKVAPDKFGNNIFIETANWLLLLEATVYDFPLEAEELNGVVKHLGNVAINLIDKRKMVSEAGNEKPTLPIILTNYRVTSGITINDVIVTDISLFKNYFFVGKHQKVAVSFNSGNPETTDSISFPYYFEEEDFNENIIDFFVEPIPIQQIKRNFCWKEVQITPDSVTPKVFTDKIEQIDESQLLENQIDNLTYAVNYEYFSDPNDKDKKILELSIIFSLSSFFNQILISPYKSLSKRIDAYHRLSQTKQIGFSYLTRFIHESLIKFNGKKILDRKTFATVPYEKKEVLDILLKKGAKISGDIRLSEFEFGDEFSLKEEKQIISFAIDCLSILGARKFTEEELENFYFPLLLLKGLSHKHELKYELYAAFNNFVDALNINHRFQHARDFCEEILVLSISRKEQYYGWGILFKCYTTQKNQFEAALHGCIFITSALGFSEIPYDVALDTLYISLKFFRDFRLNELTKIAYESLKSFPLTEYDEQKVSLSYFNSLLQGPYDEVAKLLDEGIDYLEDKQDSIIAYGNQGIIPWISYLYNIKRLCEQKHIEYNRDYTSILERLENESDPIILANLRSMLFGDGKETKEVFIKSLLAVRETRSSSDYIHEISQLRVIANNLILNSLNPIDYDGLLLAGFVLNDQSLVFDNIYIESGTVAPVHKPKDEQFEKKIRAYSSYLTENIPLKISQLFIWLFNCNEDVYALIITPSKELNLVHLKKWDIKLMNSWTGNLNSFYFNSSKKSYYDTHEQESDYQKIIKELSFASVDIDEEFDELLFSSSIELSRFPANLLIQESDFIASSKPVSNVISVEWITKYGNDIKIKQNWSSSAWVPIEDEDATVNWGYNKILPILKRLGAKVHTTRYPEHEINSDINIFLAHGELESTGFKAIYTNDKGESVILYPQAIFGKGRIAILFICNSGAARDEFYSQSINSFSMQLLNGGYNSVVAPFWPFDVAISPIWLLEFINVFNDGFSVSEAVYLANFKVSKYNESTSSAYLAPQGRLAMHLYGNPNIYIE